MSKSKRPAREAALRALYKIELAKSSIADAVLEMVEHADLPPSQIEYAERIVRGVRDKQPSIDRGLSSCLEQYGLGRLAVVDKIILRIAAYELSSEPAIPPAVSIDEAIEISRKYSNAESGAFVNGVLDAYLKTTPKARWDPDLARSEVDLEEAAPPHEIEVVEEEIDADSEEAAKLAKVHGWTLRSSD